MIPKTGVRYYGGQQWALSVVPVMEQTYQISCNILPLLPLFKQTHLILRVPQKPIFKRQGLFNSWLLLLLITQAGPLINPRYGEQELSVPYPGPYLRARPTSIWKHKLL